MAAHREFLRQQEAELPRLPVPPLHQTLQRFLRSAKPFLSDLEMLTTSAVAAEFARPGGDGERLQRHLEARARQTPNWLSEWWLNAAYLDARRPLPVFSNTGMAFLTRRAGDQLAVAASYIAAVLDFKTKLLRNELPTERMGGQTLDMSQYHKFFGSCRVPGEGRDHQRMPDVNLASHIVVFFSVPVYGEQGEVLNQSQILAQLTDVVAQSPHPSPTPVGILTTENRDTWYRMREALLQAGEQSRESLEAIERSLFVLCLDGPHEATGGLQMLHGCGSNSANRWFDKTVQFIVGAAGEMGLSFEHSFGDPVDYLTDFVDDFCKLGVRETPPATSRFARPRHLDFNVPEQVTNAIKTAQKNIEKLAESVELCCYSFKNYGRDFMKTHKFSPDSYIQAAIQLAFYRLHKEPGAQYESTTTRKFLHGRTETIRSCSLESVLFARTMLDPGASDVDKAGALRMAVQAHREYALQAMSGQGVDRHLLGLRLAAAEVGMEVPQLFLDAGYTRSGHMRLSTSQVATRCHSYAFFAPLVTDGYGCCYNPRPDEIIFGTSAFNSCSKTSAAEFCRALEKSLVEMRDITLSQKTEAKL